MTIQFYLMSSSLGLGCHPEAAECFPLPQVSPSFQRSAGGVESLLGLGMGMTDEVQWCAGVMDQLSFLTPGQHDPPPTWPHTAPQLCHAVSISLVIFLSGLPILLVLRAQD